MAGRAALARYSIGVGDRFAQEAHAQLQACIQAMGRGTVITPVWNKSNREHNLIGSQPAETRACADRAVQDLGWPHPYFVDADHIGLSTVDRFLPHADFYTIDVADFIGQTADPVKLGAFIGRHPELAQPLSIPGVAGPLELSSARLQRIAEYYLTAIEAAGQIYKHIAARKNGPLENARAVAAPPARWVTEVSMDETESPQTPAELLVILAALADQGVPVQTIAPKFSGRFNKGVDYVGDLARFENEFRDDLAIISFAVKQYQLPPELKLSIHSGSDKFSLYPIMRRAIRETGAGLHLKTAGTTWLEELIGLAEAGGDALGLVKRIYREALARMDELCAPYATVVHIRPARVPSSSEVDTWSSDQLVSALRHDPQNPSFNPDLRQLLHVSFKVAAEIGTFKAAIASARRTISRNVTANLYERHIVPLFLE